MGAHVDGEVVYPGKAGITAFFAASVGLLTSMHALVLLQIAALAGHKLTAWVTASAGGPGAGVDAAVDGKVGFALACKAAAWFWTLEGPVCSV